MRKYYRSILVAISFALLVGCQSTDGNMFAMQPSDAAITTSVQQAVMHDKALAHTRIHVQTNNGVVMLSGRVRTIRQSDMAGDLARKTNGVRSVQNNIVVRR